MCLLEADLFQLDVLAPLNPGYLFPGILLIHVATTLYQYPNPYHDLCSDLDLDLDPGPGPGRGPDPDPNPALCLS